VWLQAVTSSVNKTGRLLVSHEAPLHAMLRTHATLL
jgi:pyruvate/2-oxoglutarate/acetoin dehydrogenase E1 component